MQPDPQPASSGRRLTAGGRRRRGYGNRAPLRLGSVLNASWFDRAVNIAVLIAAIAYLALMVDKFHGDSVMIGFRPIGAPRAEVLYGFGRPEYVGNSASDWVKVDAKTAIDGYQRWRYASEGGGTFEFDYDAAGLSDRVSCFQLGADKGACPSLFWVSTGDLEDSLAYQLGAPPVRVLSGTSAVLRYPSIGAEFELQQFRIRRLSITSNKSPVVGRIPRFIRFLIP